MLHTRKGHPYSSVHVLRSLPIPWKVFLIFTFLLAVYGVVRLFDDQEAFPVDKVPPVETVPVKNDKAYEEMRQQLKLLNEENQSLKTQLKNNLDEKMEKEREIPHVKKHQGSMGIPGPLKKEGRGEPLGNFDWENLVLEDNSTERRFWVKTATNEEGHHFYRRMLISNGWIETANPSHPDCYFQFYGRFVPGLKAEFPMFVEGKNVINHIPGEFAVLNKEPYLQFMRDNSRNAGCDYSQFHPESYLIHLQEDCEDMFRFGDYPHNQYMKSKETEAERDSTYWFWKPPFNSFGRGIKISTLGSLREQFGFGEEMRKSKNRDELLKEQCAFLEKNMTGKGRLLVQRAVDKPYLIKGTKFDFRAYILIANTKPYVVYFKFGHVRRCLRDFDISSTVKKAHVCNDYSDEIDNDDFPLDDHIWPYDIFKNYLVGMGYKPEEVDHGFEHNLKRAFLQTFRRFKDELPRKNGYWLLLGLDVAIDEDWGVKILEINTNPSMHYGTKTWGARMVDRNFKQMSEVLELVWDAHEKSKRVPIPENELVMKTKYGFHLIYSENVIPAFQYSKELCFEQDRLNAHPPSYIYHSSITNK